MGWGRQLAQSLVGGDEGRECAELSPGRVVELLHVGWERQYWLMRRSLWPLKG